MARERIQLPGLAGAHLLGRARPAASARASRSTRWSRAASSRRRSSSAAITSIPARSHRRIARPKACSDGSDAVSDWPLLNALLNTASGATWVSIHHGGGVGMGYSQHAGVVIVCDGTPAAARRIERVLWNDPATGVMRHADAGYEEAIDCARENGLKLPML